VARIFLCLGGGWLLHSIIDICSRSLQKTQLLASTISIPRVRPLILLPGCPWPCLFCSAGRAWVVNSLWVVPNLWDPQSPHFISCPQQFIGRGQFPYQSSSAQIVSTAPSLLGTFWCSAAFVPYCFAYKFIAWWILIPASIVPGQSLSWRPSFLDTRGIHNSRDCAAFYTAVVVRWCNDSTIHILGVSKQNIMLLGGCADFSHPFIWSHVSGLIWFPDGSYKGTASDFVQISEKVWHRPWQWLHKHLGKKALAVHGCLNGMLSSRQTERGETGEKQSQEHAQHRSMFTKNSSWHQTISTAYYLNVVWRLHECAKISPQTLVIEELGVLSWHTFSHFHFHQGIFLSKTTWLSTHYLPTVMFSWLKIILKGPLFDTWGYRGRIAVDAEQPIGTRLPGCI
jgi:hypothetical protein